MVVMRVAADSSDVPENAKCALKKRALFILVSFTIGGSDGSRPLTCIRPILFLPVQLATTMGSDDVVIQR